ncbi:hypothetical protein M8C21_006278 [Ambrosia artemisiifolia]|uniref:Uncharacterized protein n=1 Tax=Ambrosia artemisiifolia TaxID=4212 RepID=A0AAD5CWG1_AMBAR|nr:hypothetical protein M8C21_006278 [Ambrosia artemisiifolia]
MNNHEPVATVEPQSNNRRLVLFPLPFQGHINPMLQLANILHTKGFKIIIIHTDFNSPNQSNYPQFTFVSISAGLSKSKDGSLNLDTSNYVINFLNKSCIEPFTVCMAKLLELEPVTCLISDAIWHFTQSVADSLKLKRIVLRTSSMSCIPVYAAFVLGEKSYFKTTIKEELELMTEKDIEEIHKDRSEKGNKELILYVSFGSIAQMSEAEFSDMAWGLANSKQRFLWVVRPGSIYGSQWLESLPKGFMEEVGERGRIVKWAPQQEVLAHQAIGCFWTHNGWNSTLESICEGVPMICSPCSYDQPINARYVTDVWKIGAMLDEEMNWEQTGIAIKKVITGKEGSEMRQRSKSLQEKVNKSMQKGGSAYQSLENLVDYILSI